METQQMVQELKAERVQEEMVAAEEPLYRAWLKAERVQEPASVAAGGVGRVSSAFELMIHQQEPVRVELLAHEIVITLHGTNAGLAG
jgi:hypothetical protein